MGREKVESERGGEEGWGEEETEVKGETEWGK